MSRWVLAVGLFLVPFSTTVAFESVPRGEAEAIETIKNAISAGVRAQFAAGSAAKRDAHPKAHGCVRAEFKVQASLPSHLTTPVFKPGSSYPAWIRYSNGSGKVQPDSVGDGRGMAIKLMSVEGAKLSDERFTQDFLLINHPAFFVRNAVDYIEFTKAVGAGAPQNFFFPSYNPFSWRLHEMRIARAVQGKTVIDPLDTRYWSMTPYQHDQYAAKYSAWPCLRGLGANVDRNSADFLKEAMTSRLTYGSACFEFGVQLRGDQRRMPIEDPTIEWQESGARFVKVAEIHIPSQTFDSTAQRRFCENLSFDPWHSIAEHRPLGGINRVRRVVYSTISKLRHELNREPLVEPTGRERF